ncbi:MAG: hypothetical protein QM662_13145 [Gordonia sp. (in: high G+C Gram-positive bacteria)]
MDLGVHSRAEMLANEFTDTDLARMVRQGALHQPRRGWYALPDAHPDAVTAAARSGALTCVSGLRVHQREHPELWVPPGYRDLHVRPCPRARGARRDYCAHPGPLFPVSTVLDSIEESLMCAAGCLTADDWIAACDAAMRVLGITETEDMRRLLPATNQRIARLLDRCDPRSQSGTESVTRVRLRRAGFRVIVQPKIPGVGFGDLLLGRLLLECDSKLYHTSHEAYQNDRHRDRKSLARGYLTMRLTYDDVHYGWAETIADIRSVTTAGRHRPRRRRVITGSA